MLSSVVQPARPSRHKANRGRMATGITRMLVISSGPTELGSSFRQSIVQALLRSPLRLLPYRDELGVRLIEFRAACEAGDRRACVRLGIIIGENRDRREVWRHEHPEAFFYER